MKIFKDNVCDQRIFISYLKGHNRANCSRELLQKDQVYSQVFSRDIHSYQPFLGKKTSTTPKQNISQNPQTTAKPLFRISHLHSSTITSLQPNQIIITQFHHLTQSTEEKKQGTLNHVESCPLLCTGQHDRSLIQVYFQ